MRIAELKRQGVVLFGVDLHDNCIGDVGVIALAKSVEKNKTLTRLDLSGNIFSKVGASALVSSIKMNHTLTNVLMFGNTTLHDKIQPYINEIHQHLENNKRA